ncbi:MAG: hypothetical protein EAY75_10675 [Bacteroidetes bacterium]|nr:MAG: hypothetical protein EAY75_10675 [Bacteroidota bacterium]
MAVCFGRLRFYNSEYYQSVDYQLFMMGEIAFLLLHEKKDKKTLLKTWQILASPYFCTPNCGFGVC